MSQYGRPIADITNSGWTPIPVYTQIGEVSPDDGDYVISSADPGTSIFEVQLTELAQPEFGNHTLSVRLDKTDPGNLPVTIELLQGGSVVATRVVPTPALSFYTYDFILTDIEVDAITDYANLRLRVTVTSEGNSSSSSAASSQSGTSGGSNQSSTTSGQSGTSGTSGESSTTSGQSATSGTSGESSATSDQSGSSEGSTGSSIISSQSSTSESSSDSLTSSVSSFSNPTSTSDSSSSTESSGSSSPSSLDGCCGQGATRFATFFGGSNGCTCMNNHSIALTWAGLSWSGSSSAICGGLVALHLSCDNGIWSLTNTSQQQNYGQPDSVNCDPIAIAWHGCSFPGLCNGTADVLIT